MQGGLHPPLALPTQWCNPAANELLLLDKYCPIPLWLSSDGQSRQGVCCPTWAIELAFILIDLYPNELQLFIMPLFICLWFEKCMSPGCCARYA